MPGSKTPRRVFTAPYLDFQPLEEAARGNSFVTHSAVIICSSVSFQVFHSFGWNPDWGKSTGGDLAGNSALASNSERQCHGCTDKLGMVSQHRADL